ncbi:hypothetical protein TorRG33x02_344770 [Trema orientale]|uniref:Uncharacterized protein n=1 Tax=Trema orientale TaxID=63057 RepID=A0A2P5APU3_TREOI|nr:hypothetical protein TorRG33x02_344770 [Trema orientale]
MHEAHIQVNYQSRSNKWTASLQTLASSLAARIIPGKPSFSNVLYLHFCPVFFSIFHSFICLFLPFSSFLVYTPI